jgi:hypothetical protein
MYVYVIVRIKRYLSLNKTNSVKDGEKAQFWFQRMTSAGARLLRSGGGLTIRDGDCAFRRFRTKISGPRESERPLSP